MRYALDPAVRRRRDGRLLSGGAPPRIVRLTERGSRVLDDALAGRPVGDGAPQGLLRRLDDQGMIHPVGARRDAAAPAVTAVVPIRGAPPGLEDLVRALRSTGEVVVVDDGAAGDAVRRARAAGAIVVPNAGPPGPSAARNTGIEAARGELLALVDADVVVQPDWQAPLLGLFADPALAVAAPVVGSLPGRSAVARYEAAYSALELGDRPALVGPGRRLAYVPSAALIARRSALRSVGGFDPSLLIGEDVDLVWRLLAAGWKVRYAPEARVLHTPRRSVRALARQRYVYGRSSVVLEARHPGAASPLRVGAPTLCIWAAALLAGPAGAVAVLAGSVAGAVAAGAPGSSRTALARIVMLGHLESTRHLARVATREYLPVTALACVRSRRARRWGALAFAADLALSRRHAVRGRDLPVHVALRMVDQLAYTAGLWRGALAARSAAAVTVRLGPLRPRARPGG